MLLGWWRWRKRAHKPAAQRPVDNLDTIAAWPPQATRVLTTAERDAFDVLRAALPAHMILAQVSLQRFLKVPTRNSYAEWLRRVGQLSADLLVCDRHAQVIAVVEVQANAAPLSPRAQKRRDRLSRVLKAADIPVHVWLGTLLPSVEAAREAIGVSASIHDDADQAVPFAASIRSLPGRLTTTRPQFQSDAQETPTEEVIEMREPPPSTWFDDFDSAAVPLSPEPLKGSREPRGRSGS